MVNRRTGAVLANNKKKSTPTSNKGDTVPSSTNTPRVHDGTSEKKSTSVPTMPSEATTAVEGFTSVGYIDVAEVGTAQPLAEEGQQQDVNTTENDEPIRNDATVWEKPNQHDDDDEIVAADNVQLFDRPQEADDNVQEQ